MIKNDEIDLIINTVEGRQATRDSSSIRRSAENHRVYYNTTLAAGIAVCMALNEGLDGEIDVRRLQDLHKRIGA
jgi:carbamoyl-phosphate synthase large subunit